MLSTSLRARLPRTVRQLWAATTLVQAQRHMTNPTVTSYRKDDRPSKMTPHFPQDSNTVLYKNAKEMSCNDWAKEAIRRIWADFNRSGETHLHKVIMPGTAPDVYLYLKDESIHPSGSLKHRLARSLFLYALVNGYISEGTPVIESSSGSTAISEAYFAKLLGLPFIAVMPATTQRQKIEAIEFWGGRCHLVKDPSAIYETSRQLAEQLGGHYMDQFTNAERATDWKGNNNIAEAIFKQLKEDLYEEPTWIVVGGGTGGTATTLARHVRYHRHDTRICVVDPENSVFLDCYRDGDTSYTSKQGSAIEGIGRPRFEPSFSPQLIDCMMRVPDTASFAAMHFLAKKTGLQGGPSTGTNLYGSLKLICNMKRHHEKGAVVTLVCDKAERYRNTCMDMRWLWEKNYFIDQYTQQLEHAWETGEWVEVPEAPCSEDRSIGVYDI